MPDDRLKCLAMGSYQGGIDHRDQYDGVRDLARVAAVSPDDPKYAKSTLQGFVQRLDQVRTDIALRSPPPTERTRSASLSFARLVLSQAAKTPAQPSSFVRAVSSETLSVGA